MTSTKALSLRKDQLGAELRVRQENFIRKERVLNTKIDELETKLDELHAKKTSWMENDVEMINLKKMHEDIQCNVGIVQHRTARLVQEQELDLLRAFRARLADVQIELEKEKEKTDDGAMAWIDRSRTLEGQVDTEKDRADKLDRINQTKGRENARLKQKFQMMEDDRKYLVKKLVAHKKQNQRLRTDLVEHDNQLQTLRREVSGSDDLLTNVSQNTRVRCRSERNEEIWADGSSCGEKVEGIIGEVGKPNFVSSQNAGTTELNVFAGSGNGKFLFPRQQADSRFTDIVNRLTKMLEMERRHRVQVQAALDEHNASITPLERSLQVCVEEVCSQKRYGNNGFVEAIDGATVEYQNSDLLDSIFGNVLALNSEGRERGLELWLSMGGVIEQLCD